MRVNLKRSGRPIGFSQLLRRRGLGTKIRLSKLLKRMKLKVREQTGGEGFSAGQVRYQAALRIIKESCVRSRPPPARYNFNPVCRRAVMPWWHM